jgi:hypothetical protein
LSFGVLTLSAVSLHKGKKYSKGPTLVLAFQSENLEDMANLLIEWSFANLLLPTTGHAQVYGAAPTSATT